MIYSFDVLCETTDTATAKKEQVLPIAKGIITFISVIFPKGCCGLVHCVLLHHEHQIAPSTESLDFIGNAFPIEWGEYYEIYQPPYELKAKVWGIGCDFDHRVVIKIAVLPRRGIMSLAVGDAIKSAFGMVSPKRIFTSGGQNV